MSGLPSILGGASAGLFAADVLGPAAENMMTDNLSKDMKSRNLQQEEHTRSYLRAQRVDEAKRTNVERLIRMMPDTYNMVAAGRRVPKGATIVGRIDEGAVDELALKMAQGTL